MIIHSSRVTPPPRRRWAPMALVLATLPMVIYADVPHTFKGKNVILATEVNSNFANLDGRIGVYEDAISVDGNGNVGVGTESPSSLLQLSGQSDSVWDPNFFDDTAPELEIHNGSSVANSYAGVILHVNGAGNARARIAALNTGSTDNSHLVFATEGGNTVREQMRITNSGNVGIGTTNPDYRLEVDGTIRSTSNVVGQTLWVTSGSEGGIRKAVESGNILNFRNSSGVIEATIDTSGNVGIGSTSPNTRLEVSGSGSKASNGIRSTGAGSAITMWAEYGGGVISATGNSTDLYIRDSGNVGIGTTSPTQKLHVVGNVTANDYLYNSDRRLKRDILPLESALEQVQCLEGVSYRWESPEASQDLQVGLIAQDVEACMPEVVTTDPTGYKSVSYARLVAPLIEAVKEQQHTISVLETRDSTQQQQITALEARLARLEALLQTRR